VMNGAMINGTANANKANMGYNMGNSNYMMTQEAVMAIVEAAKGRDVNQIDTNCQARNGIGQEQVTHSQEGWWHPVFIGNSWMVLVMVSRRCVVIPVACGHLGVDDNIQGGGEADCTQHVGREANCTQHDGSKAEWTM
jgi:hypothetical protein